MNRAMWMIAVLLAAAAAAVSAQSISASGSGCGRLEPGPPQNLKAVAAGQTSIRVTWSAPANGACVDNYAVDVQPKIQPRTLGATSPTNTNTKNFEVTVSGLQPGTAYLVKVTAQSNSFSNANKNAAGPVEVTTLSAGCTSSTAPGGLQNLRADNSQPGSVKLTWGPPTNNACVDTYSVSCMPLVRGLGSEKKQAASGGSVVIEGLRPGCYNCDVTANNKAGSGPPTTAVVEVK